MGALTEIARIAVEIVKIIVALVRIAVGATWNALKRLLGMRVREWQKSPDSPGDPALFYFCGDKEESELFRQFHFSEGVTRYIMVEPLWQAFETFYRAPQPLSWWLITGKPGAGKSRTAFEFCKALETGKVEFFQRGKFVPSDIEPVIGEDFSVWKAGFLDFANTPFAKWEKWQPREHTLLVVDAASKHYNARLGPRQDGEDVRYNRFNIVEIIKLLAQKAERGDFGLFRVRLLLLDQEYGAANEKTGDGLPDWYRTLYKDESDGLSWRFREGVTPLPPITSEGLSCIAQDMQESVKQYNPEALYVVPRDFSKKLKSIDAERRPLFAMLLAAYAAVDNNLNVTQRDVLEHVVRCEYERVLRTVGLERTPRILKDLTLSTLSGGKSGMCKLESAHELWHSGLGFVDSEDSAMFCFYPIEPDLLGEYLVLYCAGRRDIFDTASISNNDMRFLVYKAWESAPIETADFFERSQENFSSDPEWIEVLFLDERLTIANAIVKLRYVQTAVSMIVRISKEEIAIARKIFKCLNNLGENGMFRRERARASASLIRLCCEAGLFDEASSLFLEMRALGETDDIRICRAEASAYLIEGLCKVGELVRARVMFEGTLAFDLTKEVQISRARALLALFNAYGKAGELGEARGLFDSLPSCGESDAVLGLRAKASVNMLALYGKTGNLAEATAIYESMLALGNAPDVCEARGKAFKFVEFFAAAKPKHAGQGQEQATAKALATIEAAAATAEAAAASPAPVEEPSQTETVIEHGANAIPDIQVEVTQKESPAEKISEAEGEESQAEKIDEEDEEPKTATAA